MKPHLTTHLLLSAIALLLLAVLLRPLSSPEPVAAQTVSPPSLYFEPGVYMLRNPDASGQVLGKVAVDLHSGAVWGFPTNTQDPYPGGSVDSKPRTSHPFFLGRFALEDMKKNAP